MAGNHELRPWSGSDFRVSWLLLTTLSRFNMASSFPEPLWYIGTSANTHDLRHALISDRPVRGEHGHVFSLVSENNINRSIVKR